MLTVICRSWAFKWLKSESHIASLCVATLAQCGNGSNLTQKSYQSLSVRQRTDNHQQLGFRAEVFKWQNITSAFTMIFSIAIRVECIACTNNPIKLIKGGLLTIKLVYTCQACLVLEEFWSPFRSAKQS